MKVERFADVQLLKPNPSVRALIEQLLLDAKCSSEVMPYFNEDGMDTGHKVMNLHGAVSALRSFDRERKLDAFKLGDWQLGLALLVVIRQRYRLTKYWRLQDVNSKRAVLAVQQRQAA